MKLVWDDTRISEGKGDSKKKGMLPGDKIKVKWKVTAVMFGVTLHGDRTGED